jgi:hypothetical protein
MQVPLGVIDKNETSTKDMIAILRELHKYVPAVEEEVCVPLEDGEQIVSTKQNQHYSASPNSTTLFRFR